MFVKAYESASHFTKPVVISHQNIDGSCSSGIGAFVVINADGWVVTAAHIVSQFDKLGKACDEYRKTEKEKTAIRAEASLDKKARSKRLKALPKFYGTSPTNVSAWWAWDNVRAVKTFGVPGVDLAFVKLDGFNPASVRTYPVFKDPTKGVVPGKSLCRIGFPFSSVSPSHDTASSSFILPPGSLPLPLFPNEGLFTRTVVVSPDPPIPKPPSYRLMFLETSSPGLRGQSGGPIFDVDGNIWAIQSQTRHYPLGFSPPVPNGKSGEKEHQFMNIGWGVHVETIIGAMDDLGIAYAKSAS